MKVIALACDGETTCFDKIGGDLIKWAFVEILENYTLGREMEWSLRPESTKYFNEASQKIHGISYWQASQFPHRRDSLISMLHWLKLLENVFPIEMVYHANGRFDFLWLMNTFMKEELQGYFYKAFHDDKQESTLALAKKKLKHMKESQKINLNTGKPYTMNSLMNICDHYKIELDHHDALSDARACAQIYCNIKLGIDVYTGLML